MPHLAPLKWLSALILFTLMLMFCASALWWNTSPNFNVTLKSKPLTMIIWPWQ